MRVFPLVLALALVPATALAQTVKFKTGTVAIGDPVETLLKVAAPPDHVRPFPGAPAFRVYEYALDTRQINVSTKDGKVTGISDATIVSRPAPARPSGVEFKGGRIAMGDTLDALLRAAGTPGRVRSFPGPGDMSVYEYSLPGREVTVTVRNGAATGTSELKVVRK